MKTDEAIEYIREEAQLSDGWIPKTEEERKLIKLCIDLAEKIIPDGEQVYLGDFLAGKIARGKEIVTIPLDVLIGLEVLRVDADFHDYNLERAIDWYYSMIETLNDELWKDGKHRGDCTKDCMTCHRCWKEDFDAKILKYIGGEILSS